LPAVSIAVSRVRLAVARRAAGSACGSLGGLEHALRLAAREAGGQGLIGVGIRGGRPGLVARLGRRFAVADVEDLPAGLLDGGAAALVVVDDRRGAVWRGDRGDHGGRRIHVVVVPRGEQAAADQVVDLLLVGREPAAGRGGGREDGVVIGDAGVVDESPAERGGAGAGRDQAGIAALHGGDDGGQRGGDGGRQVAAVGPRIADQLVPLVERLGHVEGLLRAEAVQAVGVALQLGEVVQQRRRRSTARLGLDRLDRGLSGARAGDDRAASAPSAGGACASRGRRPCRPAGGRNHVPS
jgi:hypothetical protein